MDTGGMKTLNARAAETMKIITGLNNDIDKLRDELAKRDVIIKAMQEKILILEKSLDEVING